MAQASRRHLGRHESKPRRRITYMQYCDDPETLLADDENYLIEQERPRIIADTIERLERQYITGA